MGPRTSFTTAGSISQYRQYLTARIRYVLSAIGLDSRPTSRQDSEGDGVRERHTRGEFLRSIEHSTLPHPSPTTESSHIELRTFTRIRIPEDTASRNPVIEFPEVTLADVDLEAQNVATEHDLVEGRTNLRIACDRICTVLLYIVCYLILHSIHMHFTAPTTSSVGGNTGSVVVLPVQSIAAQRN